MTPGTHRTREPGSRRGHVPLRDPRSSRQVLGAASVAILMGNRSKRQIQKPGDAPEPRHVGAVSPPSIGKREPAGRLRSPRRTRSGCLRESHRRAFPRSHMQSMSKLSLYVLRLSSGQLPRSSGRESDSASRACVNTQRACAPRVVARDGGSRDANRQALRAELHVSYYGFSAGSRRAGTMIRMLIQ
jgi:hypothetical protein